MDFNAFFKSKTIVAALITIAGGAYTAVTGTELPGEFYTTMVALIAIFLRQGVKKSEPSN